MKSPDIDINLSQWDDEKDIIKKLELHNSRLKKYGKSKFNGEEIFIGPKGGMYKLTNQGKKKYL